MFYKNITLALIVFMAFNNTIQAAELVIHQSPLYLATPGKANVLVVLDNSNSMDEAANGSAVGGASPESKSEIARTAVKDLISNYTGKINMGLMAYQQNAANRRNLHNSPYDASFDPANYDPTFTGPRSSQTKRFRVPNVSNPGAYIYYNIALPFYAGPNYGSAYCYSDNADGIDNGSETFPGGPWDRYRCFRNKINTSDVIPTWRNAGSEATSGFTSIWFQTSFHPTDSDLAQGILDFGDYITWDWVSQTWFSNSSPGRGYLHTFIKELDAGHAVKLNTKLGTSQFASNRPTDPNFPLQNAGLTPLEGTLQSARDYFDGSGLPNDEGGPVDPLPESCGKNYVALLTDGLPSTSANGTVTIDPVPALADVASAAGNLLTDNVETYMVGFALPAGTDPTTLDTIAAAGGTGTAYMANDSATLQAAFDTIFNDILAKTGASSSAATNSTSLSNDSFIYQARFDSGSWSGQLLAKEISIDGIVNSVPVWDAAAQLDAKAAGERVIMTLGQDTNDGIPFRWGNIATQTSTVAVNIVNTNPLTQQADYLGKDRIDFLRGGTGGISSALFRTDRVGKLGDIVHSTPFYVGAPDAGYNDIENSGYATFRSSHSERTHVIYTAANDGMMHGFDATTGEELLAYIPEGVFSNFMRLSAPGYGSNALEHYYLADGAPIIADADVNGWKTVLAAGLNGGGQSVYALDITDPSTFSEANAANIVLWEFKDTDDVDLGYSYIQPTFNELTHQSQQIVKMANGKWALVIGNGYNNTEADGHASTTGHAYLFILFLEGGSGTNGTWYQGTDYIKIDTGVGSTGTPNGMATPNPIDTDGDGDIDTIYAGDLYGNLWKFDVSDPNYSNWANAISGNNPFFSAEDSSNNPQPITTAPLVTVHPDGGYMIGVGTGKYMELTDIVATDSQTFYGIWDDESNTQVGSARLSGWVEQTIDATQTINGKEYRFSSAYSVDYTPSQSTPADKGWFMDLPTAGERIDVNPVIRDGRFVFVSRIPSIEVCDAGGKSWLMELDYLTGGRLEISPFDSNGDGKIDKDDVTSISDEDITHSGIQPPETGMIATPKVIESPDPEYEYKILADSTGKVQTVKESAKTGFKGRVSWEEIR